MMDTTPTQRAAIDARTRPPRRSLWAALLQHDRQARELAAARVECADLRDQLAAAQATIAELLRRPPYTSSTTAPRPPGYSWRGPHPPEPRTTDGR